VSRIFLSHSSKDLREAVALKRWLAEQDAALADEIFLDVEGLRPGMRWRDALRRANARCEAVICLLSRNWEGSTECKTEYRTAENLNKQILCARLEPSTGDELISEWQRCDLFGDGPKTQVEIGDGAPVEFMTEGLLRLRDAIGEAGIGPESFPWPPPGDPDRAPYRGWQPLEHADAAVFFGRDAAIVRALDSIRGMRLTGLKSLFVVLGPSGTGKSSFLRAGLLPRLAREDRRFVLLDIVRPERNVLTGDTGLAQAIVATRHRFGLTGTSLGEVKTACAGGDVDRVAQWLTETREAAAAQLLADVEDNSAPSPPTLILPLDQAEELFSADAGPQADQFLTLVRDLARSLNDPHSEAGLIVLGTIRTDRYEVMQTHPDLVGVEALVFDELKPMPVAQFTEVITGPANRATRAGQPLRIAPDLRDRLLRDAGKGADTLPMLSLTLSRLYTDYGSTAELTVEQYESMGGMRQVVQTEIDEVLAAEPEQRQEQLSLLRSAFIPWLATINPDNDQPLRRVARYADLPEDSRPLIDALVAKRLMVKGTRGGDVVVEVALESLLRQWDELAGWLREERQDLKAADDLERAATAWRANGHDSAWLLTRTRLTDAETLVTKDGFRQRLSSVHDYLAASRDAENERLGEEENRRQSELLNAQERQATAEAHAATLRRRSRVLRAVLAVTAVVAIGAVVAFGFAMNSRSQAQARFRQATSVRLAAEAQAMLANTRAGSDVQAFQQLIAANALSPGAFDDAIYTTVVKAFDTVKVIQTPSLVEGIDLSPDGRRIVTGGKDPTLRTWDAQTGQPLQPTFTGHTELIDAVVFSRDGRRLASASDDHTARLWNADTGRQIGQPLTHDDEVWAVAFSPDGHILASGGKDSSIRLWNVDTGQPIGDPLTGHTAGINYLEFSPDGRHLASSSEDHTLRMWDVKTRAQVGNPFATAPDMLFGIAFSPDGTRIAAGGRDKNVRVWDANTGKPALTPIPAGMSVVAFSTDGRLLVTADGEGVVRIWDAATGQPVGAPMEGHDGNIWGIVFGPGGHRLVSGGDDGTIRVWNFDTGVPLTGHTAGVSGVTFSPDGRRVASASDDGTVRMWKTDTGRPVGDPLRHDAAVSSLEFSRDGHLLATSSADGTVRLWDANAGTPFGASFNAGQGPLTSVAVSQNGHRLITGGGTTARLWDAATGDPVGSPMPHRDPVLVVAFSPDGSRVATGTGGNTVSLWNTDTGQMSAHTDMPYGNDIRALAFSPDGKILASAGTDTTVRLWDAKTLQPIGEPFAGHLDTILGIAFSPDGHRLASASRDDGVRVWDVQTGHQIGEPLTGHTDEVNSVAFSPDGKLIVSGSADATLRFWPATGSPKDLCDKLTANMSHKQWNQWVSPDIDYIKVCPDLPIPSD
jgi:WD40 repeat protein